MEEIKMGEIMMTRVDARLVHGQIAARWCRWLNLNHIIIVSDVTADDEFISEFLQLACPSDVNMRIYHVDEAVGPWKESHFDEGRVLLLFKDIASAYEAWNKGIDFKELNIGQVPGSGNRIQAVGTVSLSMEELEKLEDLQSKGVRVYFQPLPDEAQVPLSKASEKLRK